MFLIKLTFLTKKNDKNNMNLSLDLNWKNIKDIGKEIS